jgi:YD repeat-containing protein
MKKQSTKKVIMVTAIIVSVFTSCQKASVNYFQLPVTAGVPKLKSIDYATGIRTNEYDGQGRLIKYSHNTGARAELSYLGNKVTSDTYNGGGVLTQKDVLILNADGFVMSATNSNNLPSVFTYTYNSDKKLVKDIYLNNGVVLRERFYEYSNGNLIKDSTSEGTSWRTNNYEYFTDITSTIEAINYGTAFYGTGNKNALKKVVYRVSDGTVNTTVYSTPEKDATGRITKTIYSRDGAAPVVYSYTYY